MEALAGSPFKHEVRVVCVDPSPSRPPLPAWLKSVPALQVAGESEPRVGPAAVNNWLFERNLLGGGGGGANSGLGKTTTSVGSKQDTTRAPVYSMDVPIGPPPSRVTFSEPVNANTPASSKQSPPSMPGADADGPMAWHGEEMSGNSWSDSYSFIGDNFTAEKGMNAIVRNFELLGGPVGIPGGSGSSGGGSGGGGSSSSQPQQKRSAKEEKLIADFEAYAKSRDMEFSGPRRMG